MRIRSRRRDAHERPPRVIGTRPRAREDTREEFRRLTTPRAHRVLIRTDGKNVSASVKARSFKRSRPVVSERALIDGIYVSVRARDGRRRRKPGHLDVSRRGVDVDAERRVDRPARLRTVAKNLRTKITEEESERGGRDEKVFSARPISHAANRIRGMGNRLLHTRKYCTTYAERPRQESLIY